MNWIVTCTVLAAVLNSAKLQNAADDSIKQIGEDIQIAPTGRESRGLIFLLDDVIERKGVVFAFSGYMRSFSKMRFQIWSPVNDSNSNTMMLKAEMQVTPTVINQREDFYPATLFQPCFVVEPGDSVGLYTEELPAAYGYVYNGKRQVLLRHVVTPEPFNVSTVVTFDAFAFPYELSAAAYVHYDLSQYNIQADDATTDCVRDLRIPVIVPLTTTTTTELPVTGAIGATGPQGQQGQKGDAGDQGPIGPEGPEGPQGPAGPQGIPGQNGTDGIDGEEGPVGPAGPQGADGQAGPAGEPGVAGEKGDKGDQGEQGLQGLTGEAGPPGPAGISGAQGPAGPAGPPGPPGPIAPIDPNRNDTDQTPQPILEDEKFYEVSEFTMGLFVWLLILTIVFLIIVIVFTVCICSQLRHRKECHTSYKQVHGANNVAFDNGYLYKSSSFKNNEQNDYRNDIESQKTNNRDPANEGTPAWVSTMKSTTESVYTNNTIEDTPMENTNTAKRTPKNSTSSLTKGPEGRTEF